MSFLGVFRRRQSIIVVSGLPRSGTSMAMRMLGAGGVPLLTDGVRVADASNPHGYFELEAVKDLHKTHEPGGADTAWLASAGGKAVKVVSFLLTFLPETHDYRVIFMRRDLHEVVASQRALLLARGEPVADDAAETRDRYEQHLAEVDRFLAIRECFTTLHMDYALVLDRPQQETARMNAFLGGKLDAGAMAAAVDGGPGRRSSVVTRA